LRKFTGERHQSENGAALVDDVFEQAADPTRAWKCTLGGELLTSVETSKRRPPARLGDARCAK
jgi:hypothetical protein